MSDALLELLILGKIPGTELYIGYRTSIAIAFVVSFIFVSVTTLNYYTRVLKKIRSYTAKEIIEIQSI